MLRILVKENISIYRKGICESIRESFPDAHCHAISDNVLLATEAFKQQWDLIIVGTLSFQETFLGSTYVKKIAPYTPLIILEDERATENIEKLAPLGVYAYLNKNSKIEEIMRHIQGIAATAKQH